MGVIALFNLIYGLESSLFPFHIVDYDTKRGYDALVSQRALADLSRESMYFIKFKHTLDINFNHAFAHLAAIICWACNLSDGSEVNDIENRVRELRITPLRNSSDYTRYMLVSPTERHNVEVFVLKDYLRQKLGIEFRPRQRVS